MPKFTLGTKMSDTPVKSAGAMFFPTVHIDKKIPQGMKVGKNISGEFTGKISAVREDGDSKSFTIELKTIEFGMTTKKFEKLSDKEQEEVLDKDRK